MTGKPDDTVLRVSGLSKEFPSGKASLKALCGIDLDIRRGETLALAGESGCGKSTLGKVVMRLHEPTSGDIELDGEVITRLSRRQFRARRHKIQMIFQDPMSSLNPRFTVGRILEEPFIIHKTCSSRERRDRVASLMEQVGLRPEFIDRFPHEFSGGQRQRIGIARAIALNPQLVICDEPVSALDVSVQGQVVNLLTRLQRDMGLSYLFISHDLAIIQRIADRIAVMYLGKIVELAEADAFFIRPMHPYSAALLTAVPVPDPVAERQKARLPIQGEPPSPLSPPSGCSFRTRCPFAQRRCAEEEPLLREVAPGHVAACHYAEDFGNSSLPIARN